MPNIHHSDWYENVGACVKHGIPLTPCPQCLAEQDPGIRVSLTAADRTQLAWVPELRIEDMFPEDQVRLTDHIT